MEQLTKSLQDKYVDDIRAKYPLHRILCLCMSLIAFYCYQQCDNLNLIDSLKEMKIIFLLDWNDGLFSKASIFQLIFAIFMVATISKVNSYLKSSFFEFMAKVGSLNGYLMQLRNQLRAGGSTYSLSAKNRIKNELNERKGVLKAAQAKSEIILTCLVCLLMNMRHVDFVELIICILLSWGILDQQWNCYKYYLSRFIPYYVANDVLIGKESDEVKISEDAFK